MLASVLIAPGRVELQERPTPTPNDGEVLIRVSSVGICASDVHYYRHGRIGPYSLTSPMILGHEVSGIIAGVGKGVPQSREGTLVAVEPQRPCWACEYCFTGRYNLCPEMKFLATPPVDGAFCQYIVVPAQFAHQVTLLTDDEAALLEPVSVCVAAVRKSQIAKGSSVLVAGCGPIGLIMAQVARAFGARSTVLSDPRVARRKIAEDLGFPTIPRLSKSSAELERVDCFIDASGSDEAVYAGLQRVKNGGSGVIVGLGSDDVLLPLSLITSREVTVTGVFRYVNTWPLAEHLVNSDAVDVAGLISARISLETVGDALAAHGEKHSLKVVVRPNG